MELDFAFVCDYAEPGDKISALGIGFDTIYASQVPCVHPNFHLVAQFRGSTADVGEKELTIRFIDMDGTDVIPPISGTITLAPPQPGAEESIGRLVVGFAGIEFKKYARYTLHVAIEGLETVKIPLRVSQPPAS